MKTPQPRIFLTGSTGYVGGRLAPRLLSAGYGVRCLLRSPEKLANRGWASAAGAEIRRGDLGDYGVLRAELEGCEAAYYLVDPLSSGDRTTAQRYENLALGFGRAAAAAGVRRIVYLGRMHGAGHHREDALYWGGSVEAALAAAGTPLTVFRAPMIIGSGSVSFEMLRSLVGRMPVVFAPRWAEVPCQPIAVRNVLGYLLAALEEPATAGESFEIGGPEILAYRDMMRIMAEELGIRRRVVPLPADVPRLSAWGAALATPLNLDATRHLVAELHVPTVCREKRIREVLPLELIPVRAAIRAALDRVESGEVETRWSTAGDIPVEPDWSAGTVLSESHATVIGTPPEAVFCAVCRIGGSRGWYGTDWLWRIRAWADRMVGGPGRRGRRDPETLGYGEAVDFWRVSRIEQNRRLSLMAEMKVPGEAKLDFQVEPAGKGSCRLRMTALFRPDGIAGYLYWYSVMPFHYFVFHGMLRGIRREATRIYRAGSRCKAATIA